MPYWTSGGDGHSWWPNVANETLVNVSIEAASPVVYRSTVGLTMAGISLLLSSQGAPEVASRRDCRFCTWHENGTSSSPKEARAQIRYSTQKEMTRALTAKGCSSLAVAHSELDQVARPARLPAARIPLKAGRSGGWNI